MPNYLLAYRGGTLPEGEEAETAMLEAWNEWMQENGDALLDIGTSVDNTLTIASDGTVSEAPADPLTGFAIFEAEDQEEAVAIAKSCPILAEGGSIELVELADTDDFDDEDEDEDDE